MPSGPFHRRKTRHQMTEELTHLLDGCDKIVVKLDDMCCAPRRSPQMAQLKETLSEARRLVDTVDGNEAQAAATVQVIEGAGAQIGSLQVTCCAPPRMPLYDELLHNLMRVQRAVKQRAKLEH